ncbi:MAG: cytochrome c nitrite reductase small subunit [Bacteroidetes bacterium GWF2_38_335]|nr:MAG: cytochrome c nitrite reductase small subunit [Bacteroidetes bacterium GWF2_38_335]OFY76970.1 MAG: cytochrome c nitrite reductase small subunit [Bacteroidetes bacterium RIFOXYA12_FULL_38_20]HBS86825.1 cytochrome c nitrite reductase small subunit [Bacteroidales bacterium]
MIKRIIKFITPPGNWRIPVVILFGVFCGMGAYSVYISKAWTYMSDDPEVCVNCHIMAPQYATWSHSAHREVAVCNDCHVPHDNVFRKYFFKAKDGMRHATLFTLRAEREVIFIGEDGKKVVQENCIRCHSDLFDRSKLISQTKGMYQVNTGDRYCWECHRETPHGRVSSLSSVPWARVPVPESPVPDWLKSLVE